jgi:hypothetical protein
MSMFPTLDELMPLFANNIECINYLQSKGVFYTTLVCSSCRSRMRNVGNRGVLRCAGKECRKELSIRVHTFFYGSSLACSSIMRLAYLWLAKLKHESIMLLTGHGSATVSAFMAHSRILVASTLIEEDCMIGGNGIIVEIDESKMGKRKYNRGHPVDGVWIVGGVEKTPERRLFLAVVENRSKNTLRNLIEKHVAPGSIIRTDLWKGYGFLNESDAFEHETVNHSLHFRDPDTGVHTNTIEGTWRGLKMRIEARSRVKAGMDGRLMEFIWRRKNSAHLWVSFIDALREVHYDLE